MSTFSVKEKPTTPPPEPPKGQGGVSQRDCTQCGKYPNNCTVQRTMPGVGILITCVEFEEKKTCSMCWFYRPDDEIRCPNREKEIRKGLRIGPNQLACDMFESKKQRMFIANLPPRSKP